MGVGAGSNNLLSGKVINYGGTLTVSFVPGSLVSGNSFKLFGGTTYGGSFASITPATPGAGLTWDTSQLTISGRLNVTTTPLPATFTSSSLVGTTLTLGGSGGTPNGSYHVLTSTNIGLALTNWTSIGSASFDNSGNFSFPVSATNNGPQFYILKEP
jgi:hypothetical protein